MVSSEQVIGLAFACALLIIVPGPSVLFVVGRALTYGRATALASVAGNTAGTYLAAICIALGVGPLLERSALLFDGIRIAGAAYLIWLGITALRHARATAGFTESEDGTRRVVPSRPAAFRIGVLVGISNPKVFIILAAILPQFVDRSAGSVPLQLLLLAIVPILIGLFTDSAWGLAAGAARTWFAHRPRRLVLVGRTGGLAMIALGASVAFSGSPQHR